MQSCTVPVLQITAQQRPTPAGMPGRHCWAATDDKLKGQQTGAGARAERMGKTFFCLGYCCR